MPKPTASSRPSSSACSAIPQRIRCNGRSSGSAKCAMSFRGRRPGRNARSSGAEESHGQPRRICRSSMAGPSITRRATLTEEGLASCSAAMVPESSVLLLFQGADRVRRGRRCPDVHQPGIQEPHLRTRRRSLVSVRLVQESARRTCNRSAAGPRSRKSRSGIVESIELPLPPMQRQHRFRSRLMNLTSIHRARIQSAQRIADLFGVLLGRAFSGSLPASRREAHKDEILQEMEQKASRIAHSDECR